VAGPACSRPGLVSSTTVLAPAVPLRPRLATEARPVAVIGCRAAAGVSKMISPTTMADEYTNAVPILRLQYEDILPSRYFGRPNSGLSGWSSVRFLDPSATARLQGQLTLLLSAVSGPE